MKLPIEPQATLPMEEKMLVDEPLPTSSSEVSRLSAAALPFAPAQPSKTRASTPPALTIKPPTSGHALPTRPTRSSTNALGTISNGSLPRVPAVGLRTPSSSLPNRPSTLRSVTGPAAVLVSLEEGELGGEEEGEVAEEREKNLKRSAGSSAESRSSRQRL